VGSRSRDATVTPLSTHSPPTLGLKPLHLLCTTLVPHIRITRRLTPQLVMEELELPVTTALDLPMLRTAPTRAIHTMPTVLATIWDI
jgi:hypothetical protein